jgi:hypothetical protein
MANQYFAEQHQTARAAAALPAAGAFDAAPLEMTCPGFTHCTLFISYTRGGAGGDMQFRIEANPVATGGAWYRGGLYAPGAVASGADSLSNLQRESVEYGSTAAGAETVVYGPFAIEGGVERLRVPCAESGAVGTPGTVSILARFW